ncbi:MAG: RNA ligase partner protein [Candidatus Nanohaloarchaea archaeon]
MTEEKFVLDTSLFLANQIREDEDSLNEAVERLLDSMNDSSLDLYMPPTTFEELLDILEGSVEPENMKELKTTITRKSPSRYEVDIPGEMLYRFIGEMRERVDKGLRLSEKAVRKDLDEIDDPEHEHYTKTDVVVSNLRDNYKEKMRKGTIDSKEDIDLLLLAREIEASIVTEDQGVINWCEDLGVSYIKGRDFPDFLESR